MSKKNNDSDYKEDKKNRNKKAKDKPKSKAKTKNNAAKPKKTQHKEKSTCGGNTVIEEAPIGRDAHGNPHAYSIESRDYYLDKAGMPVQDYKTNFTFIDDPRHDSWKEQREKYGFDEREIWNLDAQFLQWAYSRCMFFLDYGLYGDVDIPFEGKEYKQEEFLHMLTDELLFCIENRYSSEISMMEVTERMIRAGHMWAEVMPAMWF